MLMGRERRYAGTTTGGEPRWRRGWPNIKKNGMITEGLVRYLSQMGTYRMCIDEFADPTSSWTSPVMRRSWSASASACNVVECTGSGWEAGTF